MAENVMDQIVATLRQDGAKYYPQRGELRNVRVVGHTPKTDHYIYDIVIDFANPIHSTRVISFRHAKDDHNPQRYAP